MSPIKANHVPSNLLKIQAHSEVLKLRQNQALKPSKNSKNFNLQMQKYLKRNHLKYPPRSQSSLKSNSKASTSSKRLQISEDLQI